MQQLTPEGKKPEVQVEIYDRKNLTTKSAWLKDKHFGSKFALPGIYQPASYIPYEIWKAAPTSSNGNEQGHRNVYRDGVGLTILGGIMRGMQFDARAETSCQLFEDQGIYSRDHQSTHFQRYERAVDRKGISLFDPAPSSYIY